MVQNAYILFMGKKIQVMWNFLFLFTCMHSFHDVMMSDSVNQLCTEAYETIQIAKIEGGSSGVTLKGKSGFTLHV